MVSPVIPPTDDILQMNKMFLKGPERKCSAAQLSDFLFASRDGKAFHEWDLL